MPVILILSDYVCKYLKQKCSRLLTYYETLVYHVSKEINMSGNHWTNEELEILRKKYPLGGPEAVIDEIKNHPRDSIRKMAKKLGLVLSHQVRSEIRKTAFEKYPIKRNDITGIRFGRLVAIKEAEKRIFKSGVRYYWLCKCDCGNEKVIAKSALINGSIVSCGCYHKESAAKRRHEQAKDITGMRFGKLTAIRQYKYENNRSYWLCQCDCGKESIVDKRSLTGGFTKSCGCLNREVTRTRSITHGESSTRLYNIWVNMRRRCNSLKFERYCKRGISVCNEWNTYEIFRDWALSNGYADNFTIDRIDNDKGYEPSNCRWVTAKEQAYNRSSNRYIEYNGERHTLKEWSEKTGLALTTICERLRRGWSIKDTITLPKAAK
jgi:hypothetical protein